MAYYGVQEPENVRAQIRSTRGETIDLSIPASCTVGDLRDFLIDEYDYSPDTRLFYNRDPAPESAYVSDYPYGTLLITNAPARQTESMYGRGGGMGGRSELNDWSSLPPRQPSAMGTRATAGGMSPSQQPHPQSQAPTGFQTRQTYPTQHQPQQPPRNAPVSPVPQSVKVARPSTLSPVAPKKSSPPPPQPPQQPSLPQQQPKQPPFQQPLPAQQQRPPQQQQQQPLSPQQQRAPQQQQQPLPPQQQRAPQPQQQPQPPPQQRAPQQQQQQPPPQQRAPQAAPQQPPKPSPTRQQPPPPAPPVVDSRATPLQSPPPAPQPGPAPTTGGTSPQKAGRPRRGSVEGTTASGPRRGSSVRESMNSANVGSSMDRGTRETSRSNGGANEDTVAVEEKAPWQLVTFTLECVVPDLDKTISMQVGGDATVADVILAVASAMPEVAAGARVVFRGKVLPQTGDCKLFNYGIRADATVYIASGRFASPDTITLLEIEREIRDTEAAMQKPLTQLERQGYYEMLMRTLFRTDGLMDLEGEWRTRRKEAVANIKRLQDILHPSPE